MANGSNESGGSPPSKGQKGFNMQNAQTFVTAVKPRNRRHKAVLTEMSGLHAGRLLSIEPVGVTTLGRTDECNYAFDDTSLSREHAKVMRVGNEYVLYDLDSTNGTFINERRIQGAFALKNGDRIQLGSDTLLRFSIIDADEEQAMKRVYEAAMRDGLTGLHNRKYLEERLTAEVAFALRHNTHLTVAILDIDFFKRINDTYGHLGGDEVLRAVAGRWAQQMRNEDLLARYGGEEFVIVARGIDLTGAFQLGERMREVVAARPVLYEGKSIPLTTSIGVATMVCIGQPFTKERLLGLADQRLYRAKQGGRNRVVIQ